MSDEEKSCWIRIEDIYSVIHEEPEITPSASIDREKNLFYLLDCLTLLYVEIVTVFFGHEVQVDLELHHIYMVGITIS